MVSKATESRPAAANVMDVVAPTLTKQANTSHVQAIYNYRKQQEVAVEKRVNGSCVVGNMTVTLVDRPPEVQSDSDSSNQNRRKTLRI